MRKALIGLMLLLTAGVGCSAAAGPPQMHVKIADMGGRGYLPALFLCRTGGKLIAIWEEEKGIMSSVKQADDTWSKPALVCALEKYGPAECAVYASATSVHVAWAPSGGAVFYTRSRDGLSWRAPVMLKSCTDVSYLRIAGWGDYLHVSWDFQPKIPAVLGAKPPPLNGPTEATSYDGGETWQSSEKAGPINEPFAFGKDRLLGGLCGGGGLFTSLDGGKTWASVDGGPRPFVAFLKAAADESQVRLCWSRNFEGDGGHFQEDLIYGCYDVRTGRLSSRTLLSKSHGMMAPALAADRVYVYVLSEVAAEQWRRLLLVSEDGGKSWKTYDVTDLLGGSHGKYAIEAEGTTIHVVQFSGETIVEYWRFTVKDVEKRCPAVVPDKDWPKEE